MTGGIRVVFEYANRLAARGHDIRVVHAYDLTGKKLPRKEGWLTLAKRLKYLVGQCPKWFDLRVPIVRVPRLIDKYVPKADVIVATANETADWVARLDPSRGRKFYFIQHFEDWTRDPSLVKATWKLPLKKIVIASWLQKLAAEMGEEVAATITNGINVEQFHCKEKIFHNPPRVLMMTHALTWKGTEDGLSAIRLAREAGHPFPVTLFGAYPLAQSLPENSRFVLAPTGEDLRTLYCEHDIFLSPSWSEGCQLPPMEAMACGCAVIATNVGGIPDYAIAEETALVTDPRHPEGMAAALIRLIEDPALLRRLGAAGQKYIVQYDWERATDMFERAVLTDKIG
jgi:glycosyltransferase involved in cell wall biosynthesis